jgi:GNAT superfamily N-acetyltransferase
MRSGPRSVRVGAQTHRRFGPLASPGVHDTKHGVLAANEGRGGGRRAGLARAPPDIHTVVTLVPAGSLGIAALTELFNAGYSDYVVPLHLDERAFRDHVSVNDIDLDCSRVVVDGGGEPASFALIGRRGEAAWLGGMGTAPGHRRRGLGERALLAAIDAARAGGCSAMWLEVIEENAAAIALYEKVGFSVVREVTVWSLVGNGDRVPIARSVDPSVAHAWITGNRASREPWQRSDESIARMRTAGVELHGLVVAPGSDMGAAVVFRLDPEVVTVLQIAAVDDRSAGDALLAAAAGRALRLGNAPDGEPASRALEQLGARRVVRQREMRLVL